MAAVYIISFRGFFNEAYTPNLHTRAVNYSLSIRILGRPYAVQGVEVFSYIIYILYCIGASCFSLRSIGILYLYTAEHYRYMIYYLLLILYCREYYNNM